VRSRLPRQPSGPLQSTAHTRRRCSAGDTEGGERCRDASQVIRGRRRRRELPTSARLAGGQIAAARRRPRSNVRPRREWAELGPYVGGPHDQTFGTPIHDLGEDRCKAWWQTFFAQDGRAAGEALPVVHDAGDVDLTSCPPAPSQTCGVRPSRPREGVPVKMTSPGQQRKARRGQRGPRGPGEDEVAGAALAWLHVDRAAEIRSQDPSKSSGVTSHGRWTEGRQAATSPG